MKCKGLRVKLALDESERAVGMIQYVPIEYARAEGQDLYFVQCVKTPGLVPGRVTVTALVTGWCPGLSQAIEARRAAAEFGDRVVFQEIDTSDPAVLAEWGMESARFVDDECINAGLTDYPLPSYEDVKQKIQQKLEVMNGVS